MINQEIVDAYFKGKTIIYFTPKGSKVIFQKDSIKKKLDKSIRIVPNEGHIPWEWLKDGIWHIDGSDS